mgnify:CR=1 FL=1
MSAEVVDLPRVRASLRRLDVLPEQYPELRDPERVDRLDRVLRGELAADPLPEKGDLMAAMQTVNVKLPAELVARIDALVEVVAADPAQTVHGEVTRSRVLRLVLSFGVAAVEAHYGSAAATRGRRPRRK